MWATFYRLPQNTLLHRESDRAGLRLRLCADERADHFT
jgi:hypothetical protein